MKKLYGLLLVIPIFSCGDNFTSYPLKNIPQKYRGPSGEPGQILLSGPCTRIEFFHGRTDDEADWHWYIDVDKKTENDLLANLKTHDGLVPDEAGYLDTVSSELMLTSSHRDPTWDEFFYSLDVDLPCMFRILNDPHPFYNYTKPEIEENQGSPATDLSEFSDLVTKNAWVYLQGAFVNDSAHGVKPEIHPLDAMAFAIDENGNPVSGTIETKEKWPVNKITWRVCFFSNSKYHRINDEPYLKKERTTTWYLDLPSDAYDNFRATVVKVHEERRKLWLKERDQYFTEYGVKKLPVWELAIDPRDGKKKLKVTATMNIPDNVGGIVVTDYVVSVNIGPLDHALNIK